MDGFSERLPAPVWRARRAAHEARVRRWTDPHQERAARGEKHPVYDFLFDYYSFRPSWLRRWHPGVGVLLEGEGAAEYLSREGYRAVHGGVAVDATLLPERRAATVQWIHGLLQAVARRPALFGCHGLHEWAMVYRQPAETVRHHSWPLRFSEAEIARIVEAHPLCCTHFDAFRFFTSEAAPRNRLPLTRPDAPQHEQRGCLHANMDLYKWAFKLAPHTPSGLVADCFELARDIREVDMRASPYDLGGLGFAPIPIETAAGREEYEAHQRAFSARSEPLRARLIATCRTVLECRRTAASAHVEGIA